MSVPRRRRATRTDDPREGDLYSMPMEKEVTSGLKLGHCMAVAVIALCALVATVFLGIHVFHNEHGHHHDKTLEQEVLTKDSSGIDLIGNDVSNRCNDGVEIDLYRLERTGKHALLYAIYKTPSGRITGTYIEPQTNKVFDTGDLKPYLIII